MEVELDVRELKLKDLKSGDWFVPFGLHVHFNRKASVWMVVDVPVTMFVQQNCTGGMRVVVKVAHVHIPDHDEHNIQKPKHRLQSDLDNIKSVVPIGCIDEMDSETCVLPLDHEKNVVKLQEKKIC